jgi:23S rRNA (cytidine1920-2'-O)/16S rRNA (cytidine1409-2'-O)-methyltransferase
MARPHSEKIRLDRLLVERGLAETRARAQAMILAGQVLVEEQKAQKCGAPVSTQAEVRLLGEPMKYVGRGGMKLEAALATFRVDPAGKICLDIGASTGGFTDCLLQRGASKVIAVDVGTNQLDWKLRSDPRVEAHENLNARYLTLEQIGSRAQLATLDVSFISVTKILPQVSALLDAGAQVLVLVKPQFEAGRDQVGKGGIVRDPNLHRMAIEKVTRCLLDLGFDVKGSAESAAPGTSGNREFFLHAVWEKSH